MKGTMIVAGHLCLDITPVIPRHATYESVAQLLVPGTLIHTTGAQVHTGGCVGNTGMALKKLGARVRLLGKTGSDACGALLRERLGDAGGDVIVSDVDTTSYTVVLAIPGLDRMFLHDPGANDTFRADDILDDALSGAALIHFGYPPLMRSMMENGGAELIKLFGRAHAMGAATSLDLASVDPNAPESRLDWEGYLSRVLPHTDIFTPSFEEICFMLDRPRYDRLSRQGGSMSGKLDWEDDVIPLGRKLLSMGAGIVLLKCGTKGMLLMTADRQHIEGLPAALELDAESWAGITHCQPCYPAEIVRSETGAGDVSIAAFLLAMGRGYRPQACAALAAMEGACSVTAYDALSGLKPLEELAASL